VVDYGEAYPRDGGSPISYVTYGELKTGEVTIDGRTVTTAPLSSYPMALDIAESLKEWIKSGRFLLGEAQETLPSVPFEGFGKN
jgi:uncharacterized protein (DUF39 family)